MAKRKISDEAFSLSGNGVNSHFCGILSDSQVSKVSYVYTFYESRMHGSNVRNRVVLWLPGPSCTVVTVGVTIPLWRDINMFIYLSIQQPNKEVPEGTALTCIGVLEM